MMNLLLTSIIALSITFIFLNHPLSFGLVLLIQTLIISLITGVMNYNFWFSYILFLIMVGGMLILFIYMTSIASNEKFSFSLPILIMIMILFLTHFLLIMLDQFMLNNILFTFDLKEQTHILVSNQISMSKYTNWPTHHIMYMMFMYLLITLIMVAKITNINKGPIRQSF